MSRNTAAEIARIVSKQVPGVGFASRAKRIHAFNVGCYLIEQACEQEGKDSDFNFQIEIVGELAKINKGFHKGFLMTMLNIDSLSAGSMNMLAYEVAQAAKYS